MESKGSVRVLRPKSFALLPAEREYGFPPETPDLPVNFGQDKLVLMTQDPERLFCYWEITPGTLAARELDRHPGEEYGEALRLNWPARSLFDSNFEIRPIDFSARHWYVSVPHPGLNYSVELGLLGNHGHFISILGSNKSLTPEPWNSTLARLRDVSGPLAYALRSSGPVGSSGHLQVEETRFAITDWNFSSSSGSSPTAARNTPPGAVAGKPEHVKALRIEAKLVPGSRLRVGGRELTANSSGKILTTVEAPEGLLSVELRLPGGERQAYTYDVTPGSS